MKNLLLIFVSVLLVTSFNACNETEYQDTEIIRDQKKDPAADNNKKEEDASASKKEHNENEDRKSEHKSDDKKESEKKLSTRSITVKFPVGSTQITLDGNINGFGDLISYEFEASKGQTLNASVKPKEGKGNVRINQIYFPDGKADGPFGEKMTYKLTESGNWKLIIGEDMMAGEPWKGTYLLTIEIK